MQRGQNMDIKTYRSIKQLLKDNNTNVTQGDVFQYDVFKNPIMYGNGFILANHGLNYQIRIFDSNCGCIVDYIYDQSKYIFRSYVMSTSIVYKFMYNNLCKTVQKTVMQTNTSKQK